MYSFIHANTWGKSQEQIFLKEENREESAYICI